MKRESKEIYQALTGSIEIVTNELTGEPATIPPAVLLNMFNTGAIPLLSAPPTDDRRWCRHALNGDAAGGATCRELRDGGAWCALNGAERRSPCVFAEAEGAAVWVEIRDYVAYLERTGRR